MRLPISLPPRRTLVPRLFIGRRLLSATGPAGILCMLTLLAAAAGPLGKTDCNCRFFGKYYAQGDMICMRGPSGLRLARCEMFLNNPSWNLTVTPCPAA